MSSNRHLKRSMKRSPGALAAVPAAAAPKLPGPKPGAPAPVGDQVLLSACLIVKDEEKALPECLASLDRLVDEVVVYDTGSTDATVELARRAGARVIEGYWDDDFGRARNASLEQCRGEWILWIDADERFVCPSAGELRGALGQMTGHRRPVRRHLQLRRRRLGAGHCPPGFSLVPQGHLPVVRRPARAGGPAPRPPPRSARQPLAGRAHRPLRLPGRGGEGTGQVGPQPPHSRGGRGPRYRQARPGRHARAQPRPRPGCHRPDSRRPSPITTKRRGDARDGLPLRASLFHGSQNLMGLGRFEEAVGPGAQRFRDACCAKGPGLLHRGHGAAAPRPTRGRGRRPVRPGGRAHQRGQLHVPPLHAACRAGRRPPGSGPGRGSRRRSWWSWWRRTRTSATSRRP